ncbi:MAG: hypothetical protein AUJ08_03070 [Thaumarchaeota archaeon 13_1_40CM_3_50_5]|nr:MAG: hypothetical protein AUJ08_03070 [Thaumarchaeota archaeon 13_1_40CM_3_50_5]TLY02174.1 MAG: hypothetical protein E6K92_06755 [Nitrososphaerota archaeon]TLY10209.1 MAG: hypothetical protein E6K85_04155 [Nitrososphaerota archaeon]TLY11720.1 MAG: hypothetical protein E6K88_00765 [Nitrososphaerota archaeon]
MQPHTKKVVTMTAISLGIIMFAYVIPVYIVPAAIGVSGAARCTDYNCANAAFTKCGGYSSEGDSSTSTDSWTNGIRGMLCMMGLDKSTSVNAFAGQITLNKV